MTPSNISPEHSRISQVLRAYDTLLLGCDTVVGYVVTIAMAVLTSVLILQVFYRYAMNDSLEWGNDVPRLTFIMVVLLSIPLAFRFNAHVGMDFDLTKLKLVRRTARNPFTA